MNTKLNIGYIQLNDRKLCCIEILEEKEIPEKLIKYRFTPEQIEKLLSPNN